MNEERYFECKNCGASVQGWNAAHWWGRWHEDDCPGPDVVEIDGPETDPETEEWIASFWDTTE